MSVCVIMHVYGYVCVGECVRVKAYMFVNVRVRVYANQKNNNEKRRFCCCVKRNGNKWSETHKKNC